MFFGYYFNPLFSLFAVSFLKIMEADENIAVPALNREMDDLTKLTWHTYCKFQKNEHKCGSRHGSRRYYFDVAQQSCLRFDYANCNHTYNMFTTLPGCRSQCEDIARVTTFTNVTENVFCRFQPEFGRCNSYHPMWYFDISDMRCKGFSFSGCGGNHNRFESATECLSVCSAAVKH